MNLSCFKVKIKLTDWHGQPVKHGKIGALENICLDKTHQVTDGKVIIQYTTLRCKIAKERVNRKET